MDTSRSSRQSQVVARVAVMACIGTETRPSIFSFQSIFSFLFCNNNLYMALAPLPRGVLILTLSGKGYIPS